MPNIGGGEFLILILLSRCCCSPLCTGPFGSVPDPADKRPVRRLISSAGAAQPPSTGAGFSVTDRLPSRGPINEWLREREAWWRRMSSAAVWNSPSSSRNRAAARCQRRRKNPRGRAVPWLEPTAAGLRSQSLRLAGSCLRPTSRPQATPTPGRRGAPRPERPKDGPLRCPTRSRRWDPRQAVRRGPRPSSSRTAVAVALLSTFPRPDGSMLASTATCRRLQVCQLTRRHLRSLDVGVHVGPPHGHARPCAELSRSPWRSPL